MSVESHISMYWRNRQTRYRLIGSNCQYCKELHFPPRNICPDCGGGNITAQQKMPKFIVYINPAEADPTCFSPSKI